MCEVKIIQCKDQCLNLSIIPSTYERDVYTTIPTKRIQKPLRIRPNRRVDHDEIIRLYLETPMTQAEIADHLGCSQPLVSQVVRKAERRG